MKAIVLAGGYATRLRPISYVLPKLLFPVVGKPMIYWTLDLLRTCGVDEVVLGVNYLADLLQAKVGTSYRGMRIRYSLEDKPLGTAGPIKLASRKVRLKEAFIAMNGDVIANIDLAEMLKHHQRSEALVTDALHEVSDPSRFGVVEADSAGRVRKFIEKPKLGDAPSNLVNAGIYIIEPEVLKRISPRRKVSLEREIFPMLAKRNKLVGFLFKGDWFDIGDLSDYQKANFALLRKQAREPRLFGKSSSCAASASLVPPLFLGENSRIEESAFIGPRALFGRDCVIRRRAKVSDSILFDKVTIGEESVVSGAILASNVSVGRRVKIEAGTVISPNVQIHDSVKIRRNAVIHPYKEIVLDVGRGEHVM